MRRASLALPCVSRSSPRSRRMSQTICPAGVRPTLPMYSMRDWPVVSAFSFSPMALRAS